MDFLKSHRIFVAMLKKLFHISLSLFLVALIMIETIGLHVIKDLCTPCGKASIIVELVVNNDSTSHHSCCNASAKISCDEIDTCCDHQEAQHKHQQEQYYLNQSPVFFDKIEGPSFSAQVLALLIPVLNTPSNTEHLNRTQTTTFNTSLLAYNIDCYQSFLCTYLI